MLQGGGEAAGINGAFFVASFSPDAPDAVESVSAAASAAATAAVASVTVARAGSDAASVSTFFMLNLTFVATNNCISLNPS